MPLKPTSGVYKYTCFSPSCFFTSDSFCSMLSAWSCLVWPSVLLSCFSGKGLAWHFHALFSVARFASEHGGVLFFLICFLLFSSLFIYPLTYSQITLSCSLFYLPRLPSSLNSLSCCLYNYSFFHPSPLLCASYFISGSFFCLLSLVSCHLCRMT